ncbi:hypothetical protein HDU85_004472 [Gaertneriomyces sp. JEL0708]|nr:hypothetical protein HDU85_004472 [Gaertneriomyces sp. JEL0708]
MTLQVLPPNARLPAPSHSAVPPSRRDFTASESLSKWFPQSSHHGLRGGASDIVFGDRFHFGPTDQFTSTVSSTYTFGASPPGSRKHDGVKLPDIPAGKSTGISCAEEPDHIKLLTHGPMTGQSVMKESYREPPQMHEKDAGSSLSVNGASEARILDKFKTTKPSLTHAHTGLQTRHNLPIDDLHFEELQKTSISRSAHVPPPARNADDIELTAKMFVSRNWSSDVPLSDPSVANKWESMGQQSWIWHDDAYKKSSGRPRMIPKADFLTMDNKLDAKQYLTTTQNTFTAPELSASQRAPTTLTANSIMQDIPQSYRRSHASLQIGSTHPHNRLTEPSVAQSSYVRHPNVTVPPHPRPKSGVAKALHPTGFSEGDFLPTTKENFTAAAVDIRKAKDLVPAGRASSGFRRAYEHTPHLQYQPAQSDINSETTTQRAFPAYLNPPSRPEPVIPQSTLQIGTRKDDISDSERYTSSSQSAYMPPSAHSLADRKVYHAPKTSIPNPNMQWDLETTYDAHYTEKYARVTKATGRPTVEDKLMFPVADAGDRFKTINERFFAPKPVGIPERGKARYDDSVMLGDRRYQYWGVKPVISGVDPVIVESG